MSVEDILYEAKASGLREQVFNEMRNIEAKENHPISSKYPTMKQLVEEAYKRAKVNALNAHDKQLRDKNNTNTLGSL